MKERQPVEMMVIFLAQVSYMPITDMSVKAIISTTDRYQHNFSLESSRAEQKLISVVVLSLKLDLHLLERIYS
jgi:hypothetical protein